MSKVAKFVVIIHDNVGWMEEKALAFYADLFGHKEGGKYVEENLSQKELFKIQNDFSIEILMAYNGENPQSFLKLDSSRLSNQNLGAEKAINISEIIYFDAEDVEVLFKRAEVIAYQRKHDLIWVKTFASDLVLAALLRSLHYEEFTFAERNKKENLLNQIYFRKKVR